MTVLNYSSVYIPLIFDQASYFQIVMSPKDESGVIVPLSGHGIRMWFFVDESAVLLLLSVANGRIAVSDTAPTIVVTMQADYSAFGSALGAQPNGRWNMYDDPTGVESALSVKIAGGPYTMNPQGPDA